MKRRNFLTKLGFGAGAVLAGKEIVKAIEAEPMVTRRLGTYGAFLPNSPGELWAKSIVFNPAYKVLESEWIIDPVTGSEVRVIKKVEAL